MKKQPEIHMPFLLAIFPLVVMIASMAITVIKFEGSPHVPLLIGTAAAAIVGWRRGYKWEDIEEGAYKGIRLALPAILIIILVGMIIGSWLGGGIVATMIFYGLKLITPFFVPCNHLYYLCHCYLSNRQFLVNDGDDRRSWHGHWHQHGHSRCYGSRGGYFRVVFR